jgi:hypothetical protein
MDSQNKELQNIDQGESWDESDEVVHIEARRPLDKVIPVRLSATDWAKLKEEATVLGVGPTTLARMWILERLRWRSISFQDALINYLLTGKPFSEIVQSTPEQKELEVLDCARIAEKLGISETTIKRYIQTNKRKVNEKQSNHPTGATYRVSEPEP